jgi:hypothetical protein
VRPLNKIETDLGSEEIWQVNAEEKCVVDLKHMQKFSYDAVFGPDTRAFLLGIFGLP